MKRGDNDSRPSSFQLDNKDRKLVQLIAERSKLLAQTAKERKQKDKSLVDAEKEKHLWTLWRQGVEEHGLNERLLRRIFNMLNSLAYEQAERREDWVMPLHPRQGPVDIDLPGPLDTLSTRLWLIIGAALGQEVHISGAVLSDDLIELIKACNQVGTNMSWDKEGVQSGTVSPQFDHSALFVGQDALNFYLLLCLAISSPAVCRFNGGARLKSESLSFASTLISAFGARLVSMVPGSEGLPIRLEASGQVPEGFQIPEGAPRELILAILLLAPVWARERGVFRISLPAEPEQFLGTDRIFALWSALGVSFEQQGKEVVLHGVELTVPSRPNIAMDPFLSAYMLAMPGVRGGQVCLHGTLAQKGLEWDALQGISHQAGVELEVLPDRIESRCDHIQANDLHCDCSLVPEFFPLALALAVAAQGDSVLTLDSGQDMDFAVHILSALGMESEQRTDRELKVRPVRGRQQEGLSVTAPNAFWCLGLALTALSGAEVSVKNPGVLTSLWPQFWSLYKELPRPGAKVMSRAGKKEEENNAPKRRRRIVK